MQKRLTLILLTALSLIWVLTTLLVWRDASHETDEILDGHLAQAAALLVVQQASDFVDQEQSIKTPLLHQDAPRVMYQVFHEGKLSLRSENAPRTAILPLHSTAKPSYSNIRFEQNDWRLFATQGAEQDVVVYVAEKQSARAEILHALMRSLTLPMLLALPLLALSIWFAVRYGLNPLRELSQHLQTRQAGNLAQISLTTSQQEIEPVLEALNDLLQKNAKLLASEQAFTSNAAHELKTPIAAIRMQAQVAAVAEDQQDRQHALSQLQVACDRANRTIEQLLTLARIEQTGLALDEPINFADLVREALSEMAIAAIEKQQQMGFEQQCEPCITRGNSTLLKILLRNLIDNAVRYCPARANIALSLTCNEQELHFQIEDDGPGLSETELQKIGERFYRVLGNEASGTGLGWSIIRRIAEVHQTQVAIARAKPEGGLRIELKLPAQTQQNRSSLH